jgi:hypothetical protein
LPVGPPYIVHSIRVIRPAAIKNWNGYFILKAFENTFQMKWHPSAVGTERIIVFFPIALKAFTICAKVNKRKSFLKTYEQPFKQESGNARDGHYY